LVTDASFAQTDWHATSAWYGHAPFAFWLVQALQPRLVVELGVYAGFSYFTFCEAAEQYAPNARLVGVDNWEGDVHSGPLESGARRQVEARNKLYSPRSLLMASTFDDAVESFSAGEIDLLHIDGLHTYDAVRHDFETWLPKMSRKGVVLLHDSEVREEGFGVWQLMGELETQFPIFRFTHDHGLGIIGVGGELPPPVGELLAAAADANAHAAICGAYELLGSRLQRGRTSVTRASHTPVAHGWGSDRLRETLELRARLRDSESLLRAIEASRIWRLSAPYRRAATTLRRWRESRRLRGPRAGPVAVDAWPREAGADDQGQVAGPSTYQDWVRRYDTLGDDDMAGMRELARSLATGPLISVVMSVVASTPSHAAASIDSLLEQVYANWQLCVTDDGPGAPTVRSLLDDYARRDPRIDPVVVDESANMVLDRTKGDVVALLDAGDVVRPHALLLVAKRFADDPELGFVYSDEDLIDDALVRRNPYFKPDWNPELLRAQNYVRHLSAFRAGLAQQVGGFRPEFARSQDWDLALRITAILEGAQIGHIPHILYHARSNPSPDVTAEAAAIDLESRLGAQGTELVADHLRHRGVSGVVVTAGAHQNVRYYPPGDRPLVSFVVPTTMRSGLFEGMIAGLENTAYEPVEIVRVATSGAILGSPPLSELLPSNARALDVELVEGDFNFSCAVNLGCAAAAGALLLIINDDIEFLHPDWLEIMVGHITQPGVGVVGPLLLGPDERVQHGGVLLGAPDKGPVAGHLYRGATLADPSYAGRLRLNQDLSCVTAACMLVRREAFDELGGFDEEFAVAYNDVDFCLRLRMAGWRIVFTPDAMLTHVESASFGAHWLGRAGEHRQDVAEMRRRWRHILGADPAHNPNLALNWREPWRPAFPPRVPYPWR
jgi:GT2 family glycosyltransferase